MSAAELMPTLRELSRDDKLRVVETLVRDLAGVGNTDEATDNENTHQWWTELSEAEKDAERQLIQQSVQASSEGRVSSLDDVLTRLRAKYPAPALDGNV